MRMQASLMGPVMSSRPVRHTPGSAGVKGHSSFPFAISVLSSRAAVTTFARMSRQPVTCFSPWSAQRLPA